MNNIDILACLLTVGYQTVSCNVRSEVVTVVEITGKIMFFWDMMLCSLIVKYQRLGGIWGLLFLLEVLAKRWYFCTRLYGVTSQKHYLISVKRLVLMSQIHRVY
jgi:hypothetical protein